MKTFPMLPITDKHANTSNRAILDHSVDNVTGEKSFMWCLWLPLALCILCNVRCDIDVTKNGIVSVVVVVEIDVGATIDMVDAGTKLLLLLKRNAIVVTSIFADFFLVLNCKYGKKNQIFSNFTFSKRQLFHQKCLSHMHINS